MSRIADISFFSREENEARNILLNIGSRLQRFLMRTRARVMMAALFVFCCIPTVLCGTYDFIQYAHAHLLHDNLHVVVPGRFYRSAQMSRSTLREVIQRFGIKTVLDLRAGGARPENGVTEQEVTERLGAEYIHYSIVSSKLASRQKLFGLLGVLDRAKVPILIHCTSGQNRSGVVSALWLLEKERAGMDEALRQVSIRYGHSEIERYLKSIRKGRPLLEAMLYDYAQHREFSLNEGRFFSFRQWAQGNYFPPVVD